MRAVRLAEVGQPLEETELVVPEIGPSDALIRVAACGICHSDAHYRAGVSQFDRLPITLGHEVAGRVESVGREVTNVVPGQRVCVHYLVHCGHCDFCRRGNEQFCPKVQMVGKHRDGGYAEFITVPARNAFPLPDEISFEAGAVMMCSSATALHALKKARLRSGESVAIFGFGGLGFSALQLARALEARQIYVVEINQAKLALVSQLGGVAIDANAGDAVEQIRTATAGKGVDISIELIGSATTMSQAVQCLGALGRAALVGLSADSISLRPYPDLINREVELIGVSDHLAAELPLLLKFARTDQLRFPPDTLRSINLEAAEINATLDALEQTTDQIRTVIVPALKP